MMRDNGERRSTGSQPCVMRVGSRESLIVPDKLLGCRMRVRYELKDCDHRSVVSGRNAGNLDDIIAEAPRAYKSGGR